ncbi:phenylacetaldehyde oxime monooxygenase CYP71AN24 [Ziziphus jujuba]|uniref:Phenylacetaldehyde oxime monooxygenase CYP71AN24 n=2 Tax=Ziziphus jujuba TaxID=326968 RepID=A0ABM3IK28_ZIZJJ|nr:phenylacetaldehyde oxime monooxygenase CYP71AN24 [Ziziphus jujuba]KAH7528360.1 hypothetical protein FEM48_Zijuj05G0064300 [Ziziphus jujuba var. spinosa]
MALLPQLNQLWQLDELNLRTLFHPLLLSVFFLSILFLFKHRRSSSSSGKVLNLPPSPPKFPIIGNIHQLGSLPHRSLRALSQKHGYDLMLLQLGQAPTLVISSAEMVKEILKSHDIVFSNRPKTTAADILLYGCKDVGFAPYGEYWRQVRKISVLELLSVKRVNQFQFVRDQEVELLVGRIRKASQSGSSINISELLIGISNNIVARCVLGQSVVDENGKSRFGEVARKLMVQMTEFCIADFFPSLRWIDALRGFIGRLKETFAEMDAFYDEVIEERKAALGKDSGSSDAKDFIDILLQLQKDEMLGFELAQSDIKGILMDMFLGGSDTTSTALEWMMSELMRNPEVMKKAQEEVRRVVGKKPMIDLDDINQMEYLKCVVKENLRLHPPVPLLAPRETTKDIEMGGYHIREKTRVFINAWAIQRDPRMWLDRPEEFVPERFMNSNVEFKGQDLQLIPFGFGRRGCPGVAFGVCSTEFVIANLLYWFDWKLPGDQLGKDLDMSEVYGLTVPKKVRLHVVPIPYFPAA